MYVYVYLAYVCARLAGGEERQIRASFRGQVCLAFCVLHFARTEKKKNPNKGRESYETTIGMMHSH